MNEATQLVVALTALIGALGTAGLGLLKYIKEQNNDKIHVSVELKESLLVTPRLGSNKPEISETMYTVSLKNTGKKVFTAVSLGYVVGRHSGGIFVNDPVGSVKLPHDLEPYATCNFWKEKKELDKSIKEAVGKHDKVKVRAYISDYLGNIFYSNWHEVHFKESHIRNWIKKTTNWKDEQLKKVWP